MLVITLDESGKFEEIEKANDDLVLIGGLIYDIPDNLSDDKKMEDYENEKERIYLYLRAICKETESDFPEDLHHGPAVKEKVRETLSGFLTNGICQFENNRYSEALDEMRNSGENSRDRKGKYYIFAYIKYKSKNLLGESASVLVREDYASNLYTQMATEVVERIIFHNPVFENVQEVWLDIPTRTFVIQTEQDLNQKIQGEYETIGLTGQTNNGKKYFLIANGDVYRTALSHEMLNTDQTEIVLKNLTVRRTQYDHKFRSHSDDNEENRSEYEDEVFRYMADLICSSLSYETNKNSQYNLINDIKQKADQYTGHKSNLIFAYDSVDIKFFKKAWRALEEKDYYEALDLSYKGETSGSPYAEYYKKVWFKCLKERLLEEDNAPALGIAARKFYSLTRTNNLTQDELIEMLETLEAMAGKVKFQSKGEEEPFKEAMYDFYDGAAAAYNHIGDCETANNYLELARKYAEYTSPDRYLRTRAKQVVCLQDMLQYDDAIELAKDNCDLQGELQALWDEILHKDNNNRKMKSLNNGIALSQLGQEYAVAKNEKAEETFLDALSQMEPGSPDYEQTTSYLLHYYIMMKEQKKYDNLAEEYFKTSSLTDQLDYIIREGAKGANADFSMKFALYVYIKGLYVLHFDDIDKSGNLLDKLCSIKSTIQREADADKQINGYPWEIIYKYLALIALKKGRSKVAQNYIKQSRNVEENTSFILKAICLLGEWEYARESGDNSKQIKVSKKMAVLFSQGRSKSKKELYKKITWDDVDAAYTYLKENVLTFMYS